MLTPRRRFFIFLFAYSAALMVSYMVPLSLVTEWYDFYEYLYSHGAVPYVDVREGYPPLGFLIYMPLYYIFHGDRTAFFFAFRALNGILLTWTLFSLYILSALAFNEKKALRPTISYALLPSVVIANAYSNDVIALLLAALALYTMLRSRAVLTGILLGLATLSKGFPILLVIPGLIAFKDRKDRLKLLASAAITFASASLPFLLINPFTYLSTFTHHGSRGPWETIWAIIEGYYSHGGFLHPYFDKFFYHQNLLKIYDASPYDHPVYAWRLSLLPDLLTLCQVAAILALTLTYFNRREHVLPLTGLLYLAYMLFFKGYSTQFSVSTQFYILLATQSNALFFLLPMELSHIMQMLSWNAQSLAPEFLRNEHRFLLVTAILLRSIVFAYLVLHALWKGRIKWKDLPILIRSALSGLRLLRDRCLLALLSATVLFAILSFSFPYNYLSEESFRSLSGHLQVTPYKWQTVRIDGLEPGDQVMVRLTTNTWIDARVAFDDSITNVERGVINPYNLRGSFNETMLFFVARSDSATLFLKMGHRKIPFRVTDGIQSDLSINMTCDGSALMFEFCNRGMDDELFRIAYPFEAYADENFAIYLKYRIIKGNLSVILDVFDDTDEWIYAFETAEEFVLKSDSRDLFGYSNLQNDHVSLLGVAISLKRGTSAILRLEELRIDCDRPSSMKFYAEDGEEIGYRIFIEKDFKSSSHYAMALSSSVVLASLTVCMFYRRFGGRLKG